MQAFYFCMKQDFGGGSQRPGATSCFRIESGELSHPSALPSQTQRQFTTAA